MEIGLGLLLERGLEEGGNRINGPTDSWGDLVVNGLMLTSLCSGLLGGK